MTVQTSFAQGLKGYYQQAKADKSKQTTNILVFDGSWKVVAIDKASSSVLMGTLEKVVALNPKELVEEQMMYWISHFNFALSLSAFKQRQIKPILPTDKNVQFSSMNQYAWLSNFFLSLIYDPVNKIFYPSVENGYVAFKARKGSRNADEVLALAHHIGSKMVKQLGKDLWKRTSDEDNKAAVAEIERLNVLKYHQNPFLADWLKRSQASLEEFTNDPFWGSAMGTCTDENSNQTGKAIERVRKAYVASSEPPVESKGSTEAVDKPAVKSKSKSQTLKNAPAAANSAAETGARVGRVRGKAQKVKPALR